MQSTALIRQNSDKFTVAVPDGGIAGQRYDSVVTVEFGDILMSFIPDFEPLGCDAFVIDVARMPGNGELPSDWTEQISQTFVPTPLIERLAAFLVEHHNQPELVEVRVDHGRLSVMDRQAADQFAKLVDEYGAEVSRFTFEVTATVAAEIVGTTQQAAADQFADHIGNIEGVTITDVSVGLA